MRKTDKKIDNNICRVLTDVCDFALENVEGYQWITHTVNYNAFPSSLLITCAFATKEDVNRLEEDNERLLLIKLICDKLNEIEIKINNVNKQIKFKVA